jgi:ppGpp synthetase/RelA/SpoT-type nucleotidyltranferase
MIDAWLDAQVDRYTRARPRYQQYASFLDAALRDLTASVAPLAIVQSRTKAVDSFAEKALRKRRQIADPIHEFTDLCGVRVITRTRNELEPIVAWLTANFDIDKENSDDAIERLGPNEFGYRSLHYIVSIDGAMADRFGASSRIRGLKAEIQLRTLLEHAWADFTHDLAYKGDFALPRDWERELAMVAAALETIDRAFGRIEQGMHVYATSYGKHLEPEELAEESRILEAVLARDAKNARLAWRAGKLAMVAGDFARAHALMQPFVETRHPERAYQPLLRDLGISLCKQYGGRREHPGFRRGLRFLEVAAAPPNRDPDALASLAGAWKGVDPDKTKQYYRQALELDPEDYYALVNYLECELGDCGDALPLHAFAPMIDVGIERARLHTEVGINRPWSFFSLGELHLLAGRPTEGARAYADGIATLPADWMIDTALASLDRIRASGATVSRLGWAEAVLALGAAARGGHAGHLARAEATFGAERIEGRTLIVAGATSPRAAAQVDAWHEVLVAALSTFSGTIVSGGTTDGIAGAVGELADGSEGRIRAVGYVPRGWATRIDGRYAEVRRTAGDAFSIAEPLRYWTDILSSGIAASEVALLAFGGGEITASEVQLALAFGARAAIVAPPHADMPAGAAVLPLDGETIRAFLTQPTTEFGADVSDRLAQAIHARYDAGRATPWSELTDDLRASNQAQADDIPVKLARIGCALQPIGAAPAAEFTAADVEILAGAEHGRWNAERIAAGWSLGQHNPERRTSPYLVSWADLPEEIRELDRAAVRSIPELLAGVGLAAVRGSVGLSPTPGLARKRR